MQVKKWMTVVGLVSSITMLSWAGETPKNSGAPCDKGEAESQGGSEGDGGQDNSDPIYLATGDFQHVQTDLVIPGRGLDFEIRRFYRSKSGLYATFLDDTTHFGVLGAEPVEKAPLGINWDFNYNMRVDVDLGGGVLLTQPGDPEPIEDFDNPNAVYLYTGTGRRDDFEPYTTHNPSANNPASLSNDEVKSIIRYTEPYFPITMTDSNQVTYRFHAITDGVGNPVPYGGRLTTITDRNGNRISFQFETSNGVERIASATDTLGHLITFTYHDDPNSPLDEINDQYTAHLLWKITDHAGRVVEYEYENPSADFTPRLTKATMPKIEDTIDFPLTFSGGSGTMDHARFPNGRIWEYEYAPAQSSGWFRDGLLTKIKDPNGVYITQNEYSDAQFDQRRSGRIVRQQFGDAFYNYVLTDTSGGITSTGDSYDYYVWVNDRRGAITRFKYARDRNSYNDPANGPDVPRDRQLLEKVEFEGFVDPDLRVWAFCDSAGNPTAWKYFDVNGAVQTLASGPVAPSGQTVSYQREWQPNRHWKNEVSTRPNGDQLIIEYDDDADDPRRHDVMLSREVRSSDGSESIKEYWQYDFNFGGGGGCGCGSQGFDTAYRDGNGYVTFKVYDTTVDPLTGRATGNLLAIYHDLPASSSMTPTVAYAEANAAAIERFTYNEWGQVLTHTLPSRRILDGSGNEIIQSRVDQFEYYDNPMDAANHGRLWKKRIDVNGFDLTTELEYNLIGNKIKEVSPDGDVSLYFYNQDSELVRVQQFDSTETDLYTQTDLFYDGNGNLVREEELNLDGDQVLVGSNPTITTVYEYDSLDYPIAVSQEVDSFNGLIGEYAGPGRRAVAPVTNSAFSSSKVEYDGNRNLKKFLDGEAVNGNQSSNIIEFEYDARDLRGRVIRGSGSNAPLIREYELDENGRVDRLIIDPDEVSQSQEFSLTYDAFDRVREYMDPMGNALKVSYDDNHNPIEIQVCGPVTADTADRDNPVDAKNVLLREVYGYDRRDRRTASDIEVIDYSVGGRLCSSPVPSNAVYQKIRYELNNDSSVRAITEDSGDPAEDRALEVFYDSASRISVVLDNDVNSIVHTYDADSNLVQARHIETARMGMAFDLEFLVQNEFDPLDRLIAVIDGEGNRSEMAFDSRSNLVKQIDARGNIGEFLYDGMNRLIEKSMTLTDTGDGSGTKLAGSDGEIITTYVYDDSDRLISETDDNGHQTSYLYDGLNRVLMVTMPDGEGYTSVFDANGNVSEYTDARGAVVTQDFDLNNRIESRSIVNTGIDDDGGSAPLVSTEIFSYDGLGRLLVASNNYTKIAREYDSRSNVVREVQNADWPSFPVSSDREVEYGFDVANNMTQIDYPSGRQVFRSYDSLNRLVGVFADQALMNPITEFDYVGFRLLNRLNGNGTETGYTYNGHEGSVNAPGDSGFGRTQSQQTKLTSTGVIIDGFEYAWDQNQNRLRYLDTGSGMKNRRERSFGYDSINRLASTDTDFPDPLTDYAAPVNNGITDYTFDGVHNRIGVNGFDENGSHVGSYTAAGDQAKNNQYSTTPREDGSDWSYNYDKNGNLILRAQSSFADWDGSYTFDIFDVTAFLAAYNASDPSADLNNDGQFDFFDVQVFLDEYNAHSGTDLEHWHYYYDSKNQLVRVSEELGVSVLHATNHYYDPVSRRLIESIDATGNGVIDAERQLVYGCTGLWEVIEQIDLLANDQVLTTHVFGLGIDDEVSYRREHLPTPEDVWTHRDNLGSVTSITDDSGSVLERYEYGDYGDARVFSSSGDAKASSDYEIYHLYTGRALIPGTGMLDLRFRVFSPDIGRFIQRDPMGHIDGMNVYAYTVNNPLTMYDPYGLWSLKRWLLTGDGNASDEMLEAAENAFNQTVNDRVNGIGDAMGVDGLAEQIGKIPFVEGGTNYTFDPEERAKGECWANCIKQKGKDAVADAIADHFVGPNIAPFTNVDSGGNVSVAPPTLLDGVQGISYGTGGPISITGWVSTGVGETMDRTNIGRQRGRHIRQGGRRFRAAAKTLKTPGNIASAIEAYIIMRDCAKECDECSTAY